MRGRIRDVIFLGSRTRLEIEVQGGEVLLADLPDEESRELFIGKKVELSWHESSATVWQTNPGGSHG